MKAELGGHTGAWIFQVWASFVIASAATGLGIAYLPIDGWMRGFLGLSVLFTVASTFSLSKTVRDNHELERAEAQTHHRVPSVNAGPRQGVPYRDASFSNVNAA